MSGGLVWLTLVAFVLSAGTTVAMMKAGTRLGLLDEPGAHRSHDSTTPRAGGVGIAAALVAVLAAFLGASDVVEPRFLYAVLAGVIVIAGIGLADDRLSLPSWPRLFVHLLVATAVAWSGSEHGAWLAIAVVALALAWSINLHNFMDGSNGLLAGQAALVLGAFAWVAGWELFIAAFCGAGAAAALGFLPFNFPRARVFLGDVGSGVLGLAIGVAVWQGERRALLPLAWGLVISSSFVIDATLTLLWRIARRERFTERHREHLYQYLVRAGWAHWAVALAYWSWTIVAVLLVFGPLRPLDGAQRWQAAGAVYAVGAILWLAARSALRNRLRES